MIFILRVNEWGHLKMDGYNDTCVPWICEIMSPGETSTNL